MPRVAWTGLPTPPWKRWTTHGPDSEKHEREGLVLSGGGSRACFQLGALRYLYDHTGINPSVIVGTSAGSILTVMLAQHGDHEGQSAAVRGLESLWLDMREQHDMFSPRPWYTRLQERGSEWLGLLQTEAARPEPRRSQPKFTFFRGSTPTAAEEVAIQDAEDERTVEAEELTGQARTLELAMSDPVAPAKGMSTAVVMNLMSRLPRLRGAGDDLSLILRGADASRSMYHPGPILMRLLDSEFFTSARVADSGVEVRVAMVALESGELRYMTQDGHVVDRENQPIDSIPRQDLSLGVLASCSIPAVFAPVQIGDEWYVDGGVREATPAEMAIGHFELDRTVVVVSSPTERPPAESFASRSMLSVMMRSTEILSDETERDEVAYARNAGAMVIEPELWVHDATTVDPGLMRINRDYGWLRAVEVHQGLDDQVRLAHRRIISNRMRAYELERAVLNGNAPEALLLELARLKFQVREDLAGLDARQLPEDAASWWRGWEGHPDDVTEPPVWLTGAHAPLGG